MEINSENYHLNNSDCAFLSFSLLIAKLSIPFPHRVPTVILYAFLPCRCRYFQHSSGEIYVISKSLAQFISTNRYSLLHIYFSFLVMLVMNIMQLKCSLCRYILRTYAHDDVSAGSWFIGLDVKHINERKFCCSSWSSGPILSPLLSERQLC